MGFSQVFNKSVRKKGVSVLYIKKNEYLCGQFLANGN